ncbi:MAG: polysaccharide deacetylase family protein [Actinomycetota bacterium]
MRAPFPTRAAAVLLLLATACTRAGAAVPTSCARAHEALRVPILLYHHVGQPAGKYPELYVDPDVFIEQMEAIAHSGATTLTMSELAQAMCTHRTFEHGAIAITFDDGAVDQQDAFDVMQANGIRSTFYIPTSRIGAKDSLTWAQLGSMAQSRLVDIEDHTMTHADLTRISLDDSRAEIRGAPAALREHLGISARQFAYPYGHMDAAIEQLLRTAGFATAVTTTYSWDHESSDAMRWGRLEVHSTNLPRDLATLAQQSGRWIRT